MAPSFRRRNSAMILENTFEVPAPLHEVWEFLLDVERVAPCVPGAELTEVVDEATWKGRVTIKLGAMKLAYAGTVLIVDRDDATKSVVLEAHGSESRGKGSARALSTSRLEPTSDGTRVVMKTDLTLAGTAAQFGRGILPDVARRLTDQFAECVKSQLGPSSSGAPSSSSRPVAGIRLGLWALGRAILRVFRRLWRFIVSPILPGS